MEDFVLMITSVVLTIVAALIVHRITQPKAKVIWGEMHGFTHFVPPLPKSETDTDDAKINNGQLYYTNSYWIKNVGRNVADKVQITFNSKPAHFELWPPTFKTDTVVSESGRVFLTIDKLNPKEEVSMEMLGTASVGDKVAQNPAINGIKFDGANAVKVDLKFYPKAHPLILFTIYALMAIGAYFVFLNLVELVYTHLPTF